MTLLPFALLAVLNFKLYTTIKVTIDHLDHQLCHPDIRYINLKIFSAGLWKAEQKDDKKAEARPKGKLKSSTAQIDMPYTLSDNCFWDHLTVLKMLFPRCLILSFVLAEMP